MSKLVVKLLIVGQLSTNCYILSDNETKQAIIVDPGDDAEYIKDTLQTLSLNPISILATHGHFDHILAVCELQLVYGIPFFISDNDAFLIKRMRETASHFLGVKVVESTPKIDGVLKDKQIITLGKSTLEIMVTPGHTPGSVCIVSQDEDFILTGDTFFKGGLGRTDFSYSSKANLLTSVAKILDFPEKTMIYPGHGDVTFVGSERFNENT